MTMTNAQMVIWLTEWARVWNLPALPESVRVEFSPRIRRSLGRCHSRKGIIRLNPALLSVGPDGKDDHEALLREVLCHEAAHVAAYLLHGAVRPHGPEWGGLMRAAGYSSPGKNGPVDTPCRVSSSHRADGRLPAPLPRLRSEPEGPSAGSPLALQGVPHRRPGGATRDTHPAFFDMKERSMTDIGQAHADAPI